MNLLTQLPLHLITAPHFIDKLALEATNVRVELKGRDGGCLGRLEGGREKYSWMKANRVGV